MNAQIIITPSGERLVVIPEADYEVLVEAAEDAADAAAVRAFRHKLAMGAEELVPAAVADRILDGANRICVWREHRGLSLTDLAATASIAPEILAAIEEDRRGVDLVTLRALAAALNLTLDDLAG